VVLSGLLGCMTPCAHVAGNLYTTFRWRSHLNLQLLHAMHSYTNCRHTYKAT
jgi:hypothetical protein